MNSVRPRPYPQRGTGNYNTGNEGPDKDGHNSNGQQHQQNPQQTIARGRAEDVQQGPARQAIYSPATNPYPQKQTYQVHTPPPIRASYPAHQANPQQYQTLQSSFYKLHQSLLHNIMQST